MAPHCGSGCMQQLGHTLKEFRWKFRIDDGECPKWSTPCSYFGMNTGCCKFPFTFKKAKKTEQTDSRRKEKS